MYFYELKVGDRIRVLQHNNDRHIGKMLVIKVNPNIDNMVGIDEDGEKVGFFRKRECGIHFEIVSEVQSKPILFEDLDVGTRVKVLRSNCQEFVGKIAVIDFDIWGKRSAFDENNDRVRINSDRVQGVDFEIVSDDGILGDIGGMNIDKNTEAIKVKKNIEIVTIDLNSVTGELKEVTIVKESFEGHVKADKIVTVGDVDYTNVIEFNIEDYDGNFTNKWRTDKKAKAKLVDTREEWLNNQLKKQEVELRLNVDMFKKNQTRESLKKELIDLEAKDNDLHNRAYYVLEWI